MFLSTIAMNHPKPFFHFSVLLFQFALPAIQVILFCICIGADPFNIPLAIVDDDQHALSKQFLDNLDPYIVNQHRFPTVDEGKLAVRNGSMWGVLHIPSNFTLSLIKRQVKNGGLSFRLLIDRFN